MGSQVAIWFIYGEQGKMSWRQRDDYPLNQICILALGWIEKCWVRKEMTSIPGLGFDVL